MTWRGYRRLLGVCALLLASACRGAATPDRYAPGVVAPGVRLDVAMAGRRVQLLVFAAGTCVLVISTPARSRTAPVAAVILPAAECQDTPATVESGR